MSTRNNNWNDLKEFFQIGGMLAAAILLVGLVFIMPIYYGWAITYLWSMFAVPLGYSPLPLQLAVGGILIKNVALATFHKHEMAKHAWIMWFLLPLLAIVAGHVILWII